MKDRKRKGEIEEGRKAEKQEGRKAGRKEGIHFNYQSKCIVCVQTAVV